MQAWDIQCFYNLKRCEVVQQALKSDTRDPAEGASGTYFEAEITLPSGSDDKSDMGQPKIAKRLVGNKEPETKTKWYRSSE